ncbi:hypothetical protein [Phenylobacterium sp.]|uniref:hypothetical protein n=1 Tax=Phenylobacterium sp. TaxID=1871053 RepID=UPI0025E558BC|nr:hypothetical protein [Phenylobacterium sp.]
MDRRALLAAAAALAAAGPAVAIDAGTAAGRYRDDDVDVSFSHAVALELDNTEGLLDTPREMRVLLTDRELPASVLYGQSFPPVWTMAQQGEVQGLLLRFDPADRKAVVLTILAKPEPGYSLSTVTLSNSDGVWTRLDVAQTRIVGELRPDASEKAQLKFSAPVFTNPVEADLKGPAAAASEPVRVLVARAEAMAKGDFATAAALSTEASAARMKDLPPEFRKMAARELPKLVARLKATKRVVIRRETAVVMLGPGEYASAARVGGIWKAAD